MTTNLLQVGEAKRPLPQQMLDRQQHQTAAVMALEPPVNARDLADTEPR